MIGPGIVRMAAGITGLIIALQLAGPASDLFNLQELLSRKDA